MYNITTIWLSEYLFETLYMYMSISPSISPNDRYATATIFCMATNKLFIAIKNSQFQFSANYYFHVENFGTQNIPI
jgi:hypothetical protein